VSAVSILLASRLIAASTALAQAAIPTATRPPPHWCRHRERQTKAAGSGVRAKSTGPVC